MFIKEFSLGVGLKCTDKDWMKDFEADKVLEKYGENIPEYHTPFYKFYNDEYVEVVLIKEDYEM